MYTEIELNLSWEDCVEEMHRLLNSDKDVDYDIIRLASFMDKSYETQFNLTKETGCPRVDYKPCEYQCNDSQYESCQQDGGGLSSCLVRNEEPILCYELLHLLEFYQQWENYKHSNTYSGGVLVEDLKRTFKDLNDKLRIKDMYIEELEEKLRKIQSLTNIDIN